MGWVAKVAAPVLRACGFVGLFYGLFLFLVLFGGGGGWSMARRPGAIAVCGLVAIYSGDQLKKALTSPAAAEESEPR